MVDFKVTTETHEKIRKQQKNRAWVAQNLKQLQGQYAERWIAVFDQKVVASGATSDEVKKEVQGKHPPYEVLLLNIPRGEISRPV